MLMINRFFNCFILSSYKNLRNYCILLLFILLKLQIVLHGVAGVMSNETLVIVNGFRHIHSNKSDNKASQIKKKCVDM